jgi:hypothetical protein
VLVVKLHARPPALGATGTLAPCCDPPRRPHSPIFAGGGRSNTPQGGARSSIAPVSQSTAQSFLELELCTTAGPGLSFFASMCEMSWSLSILASARSTSARGARHTAHTHTQRAHTAHAHTQRTAQTSGCQRGPETHTACLRAGHRGQRAALRAARQPPPRAATRTERGLCGTRVHAGRRYRNCHAR